MARHQDGYIYRKNGWWMLRYRDWVMVNGEPEWKHTTPHKLAPVCDRYRTRGSVRAIADEFLRDVNSGTHAPEAAMTVGELVEKKYFPWITTQRRESTVDGYRDHWRLHFKARCSSILLREFRPADGEQIMAAIARSNDLTRTSLAHIKHWLGGVFTYARRQGFLNSANPMQGVSLPKGRRSNKTFAYTLKEIQRTMDMLPIQARAVVACAGLGGFSRSELRGLLWENWRANLIFVTQSVGDNNIVDETKTEYREAAVPVIPTVANALSELRRSEGNPTTGYVFVGRKGQPLNLNNLANRIVKPAMRAAGLEWHGWHAFRRGLATNLKRLGVDDKYIQRILRHGDRSTTERFYIKEVPEGMFDAMNLIERELCTIVHQNDEETRRSTVVN